MAQELVIHVVENLGEGDDALPAGDLGKVAEDLGEAVQVRGGHRLGAQTLPQRFHRALVGNDLLVEVRAVDWTAACR